ncbi:MAG: helix-turn-helix transcriptional regulator [Lachnospiraceae bacterium]|nr:helix-turn-helix transcriptional regulator [Lachnospiraceae bacterium]
MAIKFREKLKGLSYRYKLTLGIVIIMFVLSGIFTFYTADLNSRENREETGQRTEFLSRQLASQVDDRLSIFEKYYIASMDEDEIGWILQNDFTYSDYSRYKSVMDIMSTRKMFIDYMDSYTLVLYKTGWVISSKGLMHLNEISNRDKLSELYRKSRTDGQRRYWNYEPMTDEVQNSETDKRTTVDTSGLILVMRLPFDYMNTNGLAVIHVNMRTVQRLVNELVEENETLVITDEEGNIVYATDDTFNTLIPELTNGGFSGYRYIKEKEIPESVYAVTNSGLNGWNYYAFTRLTENGILGGNYRTWLGPVLLMCIMAGMLAILTYMIYRPIHGLVREVSKNDTVPKGNEFTFISTHLSNLLDDRTVLEKMVKGQENRIREMFQTRLINEGIKSEDEWNEYFTGLNLPNYPCFATGVMVLDLRKYPDPQNVINEDAICLQIIESMPDNIKEQLWMPPIYNSCAIVVFFGAEDEDGILNRVIRFHDLIQNFTFEHTGYHMLAGISGTYHDHRHFRRAYRESVKALTKQGYEDYSPQPEKADEDVPELRFYTAAKPSIKGESYSNDFENDIRGAIKEVDRHKAYQITDRFAEHLATISQSDVSMLYIMRYVNSIVLTGMEAGIIPDEVFTDGIRQAYTELLSEIEPRKVRRKIKKYFIDPITDRLSEKMQDDSYNVMESIDRLMEKTKGNILLSECADELGVHQTYIWKILKMEKGKSFTEYAEKYKIEEAKKLLLQTNMSVQEIAASLDYANAQNFIRFFSKVTGVTPGKFRKLN